jgi:hypothetical protein
MPLYNFYRIVSDAGKEEYIGSTRQPLYKRFYEHKSKYKSGKNQCSCKKIFDNYGVETCSIILISQLECETKEEALREERRIYDERKENLVNRNRPMSLVDELKERRKQYKKQLYEKNKEKMKEYQKKYYEEKKTKKMEEALE